MNTQRNIIFVHRDEFIRKKVSKALELSGYFAMAFSNFESFQKIISQSGVIERIDAVITGHNLSPHRTGSDVLTLSKHLKHHMPVILYSKQTPSLAPEYLEQFDDALEIKCDGTGHERIVQYVESAIAGQAKAANRGKEPKRPFSGFAAQFRRLFR